MDAESFELRDTEEPNRLQLEVWSETGPASRVVRHELDTGTSSGTCMDPWTLFLINQNRASEDDNVQETIKKKGRPQRNQSAGHPLALRKN